MSKSFRWCPAADLDVKIAFANGKPSVPNGRQVLATITAASSQGATTFIKRINVQEAFADVYVLAPLLLAGEATLSIEPVAASVSRSATLPTLC